MTTNEFYYLLLVIGAFGTFAVSMVIAMVQYKAWLRRADVRRCDASGVAAPSAVIGRPVARAA